MRLIPAVTLLSLVTLVSGCSTGASSGNSATETSSDSISEAVFFGDSLTDAGTYGFRFTTNPGRTWAQILADHYGQSDEPNTHVDDQDSIYQGIPPIDGPGGLNYAQGGARSNLAYSTVSDNPEGAPWSTAVQVDHYLAQHHQFSSEQLVTLYVGTNDVAYHYDPTKSSYGEELRADRGVPESEMVHERERVRTAANATADTAQKILDNGASHVMVFELYDLSQAPWFRTHAAQAYINDLTHAYNDQLTDRLTSVDGVELMDTGEFIGGLATNPTAHGLTYGSNRDACGELDLDYCDQATLATPDADQTYVFAGSVHFTSKTNELFAEWVLATAQKLTMG